MRVGASACPECGADEQTGWARNAWKWAADIPTGYGEDDEFNYDGFIRREFAGKKERILGIPAALFAVLVVVLVLGALAVLALCAV